MNLDLATSFLSCGIDYRINDLNRELLRGSNRKKREDIYREMFDLYQIWVDNTCPYSRDGKLARMGLIVTMINWMSPVCAGLTLHQLHKRKNIDPETIDFAQFFIRENNHTSMVKH